MVADNDIEFSVAHLRPNDNRRFGWGVLHGVVQHVDQRLRDEHEIHRHEWKAWRRVNGDRSFSTLFAELCKRSADDVLHIAWFDVKTHGPRLETSHVEQVPHESIQSVRFFARGGHEILLRGFAQAISILPQTPDG